MITVYPRASMAWQFYYEQRPAESTLIGTERRPSERDRPAEPDYPGCQGEKRPKRECRVSVQPNPAEAQRGSSEEARQRRQQDHLRQRCRPDPGACRAQQFRVAPSQPLALSQGTVSRRNRPQRDIAESGAKSSIEHCIGVE